MSERIAIFGHEGRWGNLLFRKSQSLGHETRGIEKNATHEERVDAVRWATVLTFALWPRVINEQITELENEITPEKIVFEIAGKKAEIIPSLSLLDSKGVSTCSTHPLTNEKQPLRGQKVLIMPVGHSSQNAENFTIDFFSSLGMIPIRRELDRHDEELNPEQGPPHTFLRALGAAIVRENLDPNALWEMATANAELFWLSIWRTINQPAEISASAIDSFLRTDQGKRMLQNLQFLTGKMTEIVENNNPEISQQLLAQLLQEEFKDLQEHPTSKDLQEKSTIILERLANLRLQSITVVSPTDVPGILERIASAFASQGINLTAVDSHILDGSVKFMFGFDRGSDQQVIDNAARELRNHGFEITEEIDQ